MKRPRGLHQCTSECTTTVVRSVRPHCTTAPLRGGAVLVQSERSAPGRALHQIRGAEPGGPGGRLASLSPPRARAGRGQRARAGRERRAGAGAAQARGVGPSGHRREPARAEPAEALEAPPVAVRKLSALENPSDGERFAVTRSSASRRRPAWEGGRVSRRPAAGPGRGGSPGGLRGANCPSARFVGQNAPTRIGSRGVGGPKRDRDSIQSALVHQNQGLSANLPRGEDHVRGERV